MREAVASVSTSVLIAITQRWWIGNTTGYVGPAVMAWNSREISKIARNARRSSLISWRPARLLFSLFSSLQTASDQLATSIICVMCIHCFSLSTLSQCQAHETDQVVQIVGVIIESPSHWITDFLSCCVGVDATCLHLLLHSHWHAP